MLLPFSSRAKEWERTAFSLRRLLRAAVTDEIDPWQLAKRVGLTVVDVDLGSVAGISEDDQSHLLGTGSRQWSGGVFPSPLPDGTHLCILNPRHSHRRRKITLMEEICHIHLRHHPSQLALRTDGVEVRQYHPEQEVEAYGVGAAVLLPWEGFFKSINRGATAEELSEQYDVSVELIHYRVKITGASRLYQARQRTLSHVESNF